MLYDCAIIGGGPAGMSAALVLGRARRNTILFDNNKPRNAVTHASHGFLTRDGVNPAQLRELAYEEISRYSSIRRQNSEVAQVTKTEFGFQVETLGGRKFHSLKLILATGLKETLPSIAGLDDFYGTSMFNCPYCDGWELRDKPLVQISEGENAFHFALLLYNWSKELIVCTNGRNNLSLEQQKVLNAKGIITNTQTIAALIGQQGRLAGIEFADGTMILREGGFVTPFVSQSANFGGKLGCKLNEAGGIITDDFGRTSVARIYAAGDTSVVAPSQLIIAAAEGSRAAIGVNTDLSTEAFGNLEEVK